MVMKPRMAALCALLCLFASGVSARSVLEGLEIVEGDNGAVEILSVAPGSPAAQAGLQPGDRIISIGKTKVKRLDDYIALSKGLKRSAAGIAIGYLRAGAAHTADLSIHSNPLREKWGIPVAPWRESRASEEARGDAARPEDHAKVILSFFTALDADPDSLETAVLIARQYGKLAGLYARREERGKAAWCLRRALQIYGNAVQKSGGIQELVLVKNGLGEMQEALAAMR